MPTHPDWLVVDADSEHDLGVLRTGKEAQINIIERTGIDGRTCLIARKRYLPRTVTTSDRSAVERMSTYGKRLLQDRWTGHECDVMSTLHDAGCAVPYPIAYADDCFDMQYLGDRAGAAPQLARARLDGPEIARAWSQLVDGLRIITEAGWAHGDLSPYNLLWWEDRLWFIDFPQAVDIAQNPGGLEFLHRDVVNVCGWFARRGIVDDAEEVFADLLVHWG